MSSHKVIILKKVNKTKVPQDIYAGSNRKVGATLANSGEINTGLTLAERDKWLPPLVGIAANGQDFYAKVKDFYANMTIPVPKELEIGFDKDENPINVLEYLKYRFAKINKSVAATKAEADASASSNVLYYFSDPSGEKKQAYSELQAEKGAYKEYMKIADNPAKIEIILQAMGVDTRHLSENDQDLALNGMVKTEPLKVVTFIKDKHIETKAFIEQCISGEILRRVGQTILDGDENLGSTMEEAVLYLEDKVNSELYTTLKARTKAFSK